MPPNIQRRDSPFSDNPCPTHTHRRPDVDCIPCREYIATRINRNLAAPPLASASRVAGARHQPPGPETAAKQDGTKLDPSVELNLDFGTDNCFLIHALFILHIRFSRRGSQISMPSRFLCQQRVLCRMQLGSEKVHSDWLQTSHG
ncbi:hypothetical protein Trisim1_002116 [Trichoderma cf. simile WF8]